MTEAASDFSDNIVPPESEAKGLGTTLPPGKVTDGLLVCCDIGLDTRGFGTTLPADKVIDGTGEVTKPPLSCPCPLDPCPDCAETVLPPSLETAVGMITPLGSIVEPGPTEVCNALVSALYNSVPVGVEPSKLPVFKALDVLDLTVGKSPPVLEALCCAAVEGGVASPEPEEPRGCEIDTVGWILADSGSAGEEAG